MRKGKISPVNKVAGNYKRYSCSFRVDFASFKRKVAFNIFNQYLTEKLELERGKTETSDA